MEPFQLRVIDEKTELDEKIGRLKPFTVSDLFRSLPADEQQRMLRQQVLMELYSEVLGQRIAAFS